METEPPVVHVRLRATAVASEVIYSAGQPDIVSVDGLFGEVPQLVPAQVVCVRLDFSRLGGSRSSNSTRMYIVDSKKYSSKKET